MSANRRSFLKKAACGFGALAMDALAATRPPVPAARPPGEDDRDSALKREYQNALDECLWVIEGPTGAAARLGVHPNTLRYRLKRLGLARPR